MSTAVRALRKGIDTALLADATLDAIIDGRVYADASKPENAEVPFVAYGTPSEADFATFSTPGNSGVRLLHLYGVDDEQVETMYEAVNGVLSEPISLTGHTALRLACSLLSVSADPSGGSHGVVRVAALTQAA
jgi:hypothetical protein